MEERLMLVRVLPDSSLAGRTLVESRLGNAFVLGVMGIIRDATTRLMPDLEEQLLAGDLLLVKGQREDLRTLEGLHALEIDQQAPPALSELQSEHVGLVEVALSPHTTLAGKTLRQIHFREKYGLSVLAIWRGGAAFPLQLARHGLGFRRCAPAVWSPGRTTGAGR